MVIRGINRIGTAAVIWFCCVFIIGCERAAETNTADGGSSITVLMGIDAAGNLFDEHISGFTARHNIVVESVVAPWDGMIQKQTVALASGRATYDIVDCGSFMLPRYVPNGRYSDISDIFDSDNRSRFMEGLLEAVTVDGKVYAAPLMASWTIFFYNKSLFREAGLDPDSPPQTWEELLKAARALKGKFPDVHPYTDSFGAGEVATCAFFRWAKSAGARIHEMKDGKVRWLLDSPECVAAAEFLLKLRTEKLLDPNCISYKQQEAADLFGKGHAGMFVNWDMMTIAFRDKSQTPYAGQIGTSPMPGRREGLTGSVEGHEFMAIPSSSGRLAETRKFLRHMMSEPVQRERAMQGMPPVLAALYDDAQVKATLPTNAIFESATHCYQRPAVPEYEQCSTVISSAVQSVLTGRQTPQLALTVANKRCNELSEGK